ncbi:protocatechuate 3,4-dioxygenase [Enterovibrio sp. ZSDZ35]|uniref:Protocatechuate 3,4-dioxygenase n=1 Tax=Enterovibrio qingdaonensis TaxID=2899818 RepID=A0ABT5QIM1_9GAMM|nr:protocatechuate 3,4-dioxygenase [Enterovibrio sp. ZSDZ35]MDD1780823.1 protocatechuate 3,4-dioxygenase [Enterovibrio sp. ZSDZ35]
MAISFPVWSSTWKTPEQAEGPFYPLSKIPLRQSLILRPDQVVGSPLMLTGEVRDVQGNPVSDARIEFWQCDGQGIYDHPLQSDYEHFDPAFSGSGAVITDEKGRYGIQVLYPVPYPGRPPHIHAKLWKGNQHILTTQLYLRGNTGSHWASRERENLQIDPVKTKEGLEAAFVFVV